MLYHTLRMNLVRDIKFIAVSSISDTPYLKYHISREDN